MKKVFASDDRFQVQQVKQLLDEKGIACFIKNEFASGAIGELAPFDTWPEVWISDNGWEPKALEFIQSLLAQASTGMDWQCEACGEHNAASFEVCWKCGTVASVSA